MFLLNTMMYNDDLFALPTRLVNNFMQGRNLNIDTYLPTIIRALMIGAFLALLRRMFHHVKTRLNRALFPTAFIPSADPAYAWVMAWIAQDISAQRQISEFQLITADWRSIKRQAKNALFSVASHQGEKKIGEVAHQSASWVTDEVIGQVLPTYGHSIRIKHNGNYLWVSRRSGAFARSTARAGDHLQIRTIAFQSDVIKKFLSAAHQSFFAKEETELRIFHPKRINPSWQAPVSRPSRPWSSVILPGDIKEEILKDIQRFLSDKSIKWYASRGIPHRRGYLLHGLPGSGKTSLTQRGMDDAKLSKLFRDCPAKSIILIENIDCVFSRTRENVSSATVINAAEGDYPEGDGDGDAQMQLEEPVIEQKSVVSRGGGGGGAHDLAPSTVTMSGLLNAIDGVSSFEGCVLVATTNHINRLDSALSRAGRFDIRIPFTAATEEQAQALYLHFYPLEDYAPTPNHIDYNENENENENKHRNELFISTPLSNFSSEEERQNLAEQFVKSIFSFNLVHEETNVEELVKVELSMASLQGYLLKYKDDPVGATKAAQAWVVDTIREKSIQKKRQSNKVKSPKLQSQGLRRGH